MLVSRRSFEANHAVLRPLPNSNPIMSARRFFSQKSIAPVPSPADEAAKALEPPANPADDPAAARAAARRAAAESQLKLVGPEGSVPRKPEAPPAAAEEPKA